MSACCRPRSDYCRWAARSPWCATAVGSRRAVSKEAGLVRLARAGADIVTAEMAMFEWLGDADRPEFREVLKLIK